jgi:hypothetical protein
MAVAAEKLTMSGQGFDWNAAEAQFSEATIYVRPPEEEVYGRSLSTIRRLGAFMINKSGWEIINSPEAAQAKVEFFTSVEEGFGTDMELGGGLEVRDFDRRPVIGGRVMAKDRKTAISGMTASGLACAEKTAREDCRFSPQLTRSKWDHENALLVDKMARHETGYNTRIVISPFPEEAAAQSGNVYWRNIGYVPHLKRGFVQLYHATKDGELLSGSLSFDGSDKRRLREVFSRLGVEIPGTEITDNWLRYAITGNFGEEKAKAMATAIANNAGDSRYQKNTNTVDVTKRYRSIMERAFNESYVHICESLVRGRQTDGARQLVFQLADKAHHFNERYASVLRRMRASGERFTDDDSAVLHELLVYSTIEMMRALHLGNTGSNLEAVHLQSVNPSLFQNMLSGFGADGAKNNRMYSACGLSIGLGNSSGKEKGPQAAFGGVDEASDEDRLGSRWFSCPKGHLNYRRKANVPEKSCRACGTDVSCKPPKPEPSKKNSRPQLFGKKTHNQSLPRFRRPDAAKVGKKVLASV